MDRFAKQRIALRYWLLGAGYHSAVKALDFAEGHHDGTRKDGVTPEFSHQIAIAQYVRTLAPQLLHPQDTLTTVFLHDVREDKGIDDAEIARLFGPRVAAAVDAMTKEFRGVKRDPDLVFEAIAGDPIASVDKGADRIHNQSSMLGVFSDAKIDEYLAETERYFFPMLKKARRTFVEQEPVYENIKLVLEAQVNMLRGVRGRTAA